MLICMSQNTPKAILGIIAATDFCDTYIDRDNNEYLFDNPTVWIIVPDDTFKEGSQKQEQFELFEKNYKKNSISDIKIRTKDEFLSEMK